MASTSCAIRVLARFRPLSEKEVHAASEDGGSASSKAGRNHGHAGRIRLLVDDHAVQCGKSTFTYDHVLYVVGGKLLACFHCHPE